MQNQIKQENVLQVYKEKEEVHVELKRLNVLLSKLNKPTARQDEDSES